MVAVRELGLQGVSARPSAILPILPGSIATGSRSNTPPRQALAGIGPVCSHKECAACKAVRTSSRCRVGFQWRSQRAECRMPCEARSRIQALRVTRKGQRGERGPVPGAQAQAILPGSIGSIAIRLRGGHRPVLSLRTLLTRENLWRSLTTTRGRRSRSGPSLPLARHGLFPRLALGLHRQNS